MLPTFGSKKSKAAEEKAKREIEEAERQEELRKARMETAMNNASHPYSSSSSSSNGGSGGSRYGNNSGSVSSKYYSTPEGLERDELEEEIDGNLDQISAGLARLKMMGNTMNTEIKTQNDHIRRIADKSEGVKGRVDHINSELNRIKRK
jgi:synaptosomal-associated protein 29